MKALLLIILALSVIGCAHADNSKPEFCFDTGGEITRIDQRISTLAFLTHKATSTTIDEFTKIENRLNIVEGQLEVQRILIKELIRMKQSEVKF